MLSTSPLSSPDRSAKPINLTSTMSTLPQQQSSNFHLSSKIARSLCPSTHNMALTRLQRQKRKLMSNRRHKQNQGTWFGSSGTTSVLPGIAEESDGVTAAGNITTCSFRNMNMKGNENGNGSGITTPTPPPPPQQPVIRRRTAMSEIRNLPHSSWNNNDIHHGNPKPDILNSQENRLEAAKQRFIQKHGNQPENLGLLSGWPNAMGATLEEVARDGCFTSSSGVDGTGNGYHGNSSYNYSHPSLYTAIGKQDHNSGQEVLFDTENRYYGFGIHPEYAPRRPLPRLREASVDPIPEMQDEGDMEGVCRADFSCGVQNVGDEWVPKAPVRRKRMPAKVQMGLKDVVDADGDVTF
ncbi:hypothetical protein BZA77DRAFT_297433 [Pyronema omphalodes]|nr:hypothetical protein BZA77DRAFT_297433 [Pyronema omphalodes]